jgi:copper chaperone NosL
MKRVWFLCCGAWLLAAGCAQRIDWAAAPDLRPGVDACDECHMLINDPRYAAMARLADGEARRFDDILCLERFCATHAAEIAQYWFHGMAGDGWFRESQAYLVSSSAIATPMGGGTIAFADAAAADAAAVEHGVTARPAAADFAPSGR